MKHIKINGQLINTEKKWRHLSNKQRNWIYEQFLHEYISCMKYNGSHPAKSQCQVIVQNVYAQIRERNIWIPLKEVQKAFVAKLPRYHKIDISKIR